MKRKARKDEEEASPHTRPLAAAGSVGRQRRQRLEGTQQGQAVPHVALADREAEENIERRAAGPDSSKQAPRRAFPGRWRDLMELTREAGRQLAAAGIMHITQKGQPVDPCSFKGPIRFRLVPPEQQQQERQQPQ
ncbi:hypothetical protein ABPG75_007699 [Micractinium tetrahymenae]